ncbi:MAG: MOSC domain-containing protein [Acidimicrobiales bacterium]
MTVVAIHIGETAGGPLRAVTTVRALAGKGLVGDRHFHRDGAEEGQALTLVEEENVNGAHLSEGSTRRQLTVRGVRLNDLIGKRFRVGDVECFGVELCEPCGHLQSLTRPGIVKELQHQAGINADILADGAISIGDAIVKIENE